MFDYLVKVSHAERYAYVIRASNRDEAEALTRVEHSRIHPDDYLTVDSITVNQAGEFDRVDVDAYKKAS